MDIVYPVDIILENFPANPHFSQDGEVIAQGFGFTEDFLNEWNNNVYFRVQKFPCRFKEQVRTRHSCEKCGLSLPFDYTIISK